MALVVQKYGGSSIATPERIIQAAQRVARLHQQGHQVLVVVSAMGKTTDELIQLAYMVSEVPSRRELDMLLTAGERISMSLMSMALQSNGCPSISFTGSQAGVLTDGSFTNGRIHDIRPIRVDEELKNGKVVVLAGFQGVNPTTKEITTLGRGGTDTTAVAMSAHFKATQCEILKDVDGVCSADPLIVKEAQLLPELDYDSLLEMTFWGAKVLHYRSVELAKLKNVPIKISHAHEDTQGTLVQGETKMYEQGQVLAINSHNQVNVLAINADNIAMALTKFESFLEKHSLPWPQILSSRQENKKIKIILTAPEETLTSIKNLAPTDKDIKIESENCATVSLTCQGLASSDLSKRALEVAIKNEIEVEELIASSMTLTLVVPQTQKSLSIDKLHKALVEKS